jgi:hypothetical protein
VAISSTAMDYMDRLLENDYVQDKLREAGAKLSDAKKRASKRRVNTATDAKLRAQVRDAAVALSEAATAFQSGRTKPERSWGKRLAVLAGLGAVGGAVALAASDELREKLFGGETVPGSDSSSTATGARDPVTAAA